MKLIKIDKQKYRKHLNVVIISSIIVFACLSLGISQALISIYPSPDGSHFHWNLIGVIIGALIVALILNKIKHHPFMTEVKYVWDLKQVLNKVNRKSRKLNEAAEKGNINALTSLNFAYAGSRLLWELDDNTIVMDELTVEQAKIDSLAEKYQLELSTDRFELRLLDEF